MWVGKRVGGSRTAPRKLLKKLVASSGQMPADLLFAPQAVNPVFVPSIFMPGSGRADRHTHAGGTPKTLKLTPIEVN
jgi:hypothetical protein